MGQVRLYEVNSQGQSQPKAMYSHEAPVLDLCWSKVSYIQADLELIISLERSSFQQAVIMPRDATIQLQASHPRLQLMMVRSSVFDGWICRMARGRMASWLQQGGIRSSR